MNVTRKYDLFHTWSYPALFEDSAQKSKHGEWPGRLCRCRVSLASTPIAQHLPTSLSRVSSYYIYMHFRSQSGSAERLSSPLRSATGSSRQKDNRCDGTAWPPILHDCEAIHNIDKNTALRDFPQPTLQQPSENALTALLIGHSGVHTFVIFDYFVHKSFNSFRLVPDIFVMPVAKNITFFSIQRREKEHFSSHRFLFVVEKN